MKNNAYILSIKGEHIEQNVIEEAIANAKARVVKDENVLQLITNLKLKKLSLLKMLHPIVNEICDCLYLNHKYAALTLTNYLFEAMVKMSLILYHGKDNVLVGNHNFEDAFKEEIQKYNKGKLHANLELLFKDRLISENEKERLLDLKDLFRNPFSHSSDNDYIEGTTTDIIIGDFNDPEHKVEYKRIGVNSIPELLVQTRLEFMRKTCLAYFCEVHTFLTLLDERLHNVYNVG